MEGGSGFGGFLGGDIMITGMGRALDMQSKVPTMCQGYVWDTPAHDLVMPLQILDKLLSQLGFVSYQW